MNIADKIVTSAKNMQKVYDKGFSDGQAQGGVDNYYDTFWDNYQDNGNRVSYTNAFSGVCWSDATYDPKYEIVCKNNSAANNMFIYSYITDVKVPVTLENTISSSTFNNANIKRIPLIKLKGYPSFASTFNGSSRLEYIRFANPEDYPGEDLAWIAQNIDFKSSPLSVESMKSVINALEYYEPIFAGAMTVTFSSACWNALEASGEAPYGYDTWRDYVEIGKGWLT